MSSTKGVSAFPEADNLFNWIGTISGPQGTVCLISSLILWLFLGLSINLFANLSTPVYLLYLYLLFYFISNDLHSYLTWSIWYPQVYEGLAYKLSLKFSSNYPYTAPQVKFESPCFHPNVDQQGNICLDILKDKWSAIYNVQTILLSIQSLLSEPNNESPLNGQAAQLWSNQEG